MVVLVINMDSFQEILTDKFSDKMKNIVDMTTSLGDVNRIGQVECWCVVRVEIERVTLFEA